MPTTDTRTSLGNVVLISLEPWDDIWRRNQHLASRLPALGLADHVTFVNPTRRSDAAEYSPVPGVTVVTPRGRIPKRLGGLRVVATSLKLKVTRHCDTLWINDPTIGVWLSRHGSVVYDVTDDWRSAKFTPREVRRLIAAEDLLAVRARTIVCSEELRRRWKSRSGSTRRSYEMPSIAVLFAERILEIWERMLRILATSAHFMNRDWTSIWCSGRLGRSPQVECIWWVRTA